MGSVQQFTEEQTNIGLTSLSQYEETQAMTGEVAADQSQMIPEGVDPRQVELATVDSLLQSASLVEQAMIQEYQSLTRQRAEIIEETLKKKSIKYGQEDNIRGNVQGAVESLKVVLKNHKIGGVKQAIYSHVQRPKDYAYSEHLYDVNKCLKSLPYYPDNSRAEAFKTDIKWLMNKVEFLKQKTEELRVEVNGKCERIEDMKAEKAAMQNNEGVYGPSFPEVSFCGYTVPHPAEAKMHFRIQTYESKALDMLKRGLQDLEKICDHTEATFQHQVDQFKNDAT